MPAPPFRYWIDLSTADFARLRPRRLIALLPVGATEQHGPHLPLSVDSRIAAALVKRVTELVPPRFPLSVLPMQHFGVSPEHADFPGTLTLSSETMIALLMDIGRSVAASGVRKLAILNSHGGQPHMLDIAAQRLRRECGLLVFPLNAYRYWQAERHFPAEEAAHGIHGGAAETSIMLAIDAPAVRGRALRDFPSLGRAMARRYKHLRPYGRTAGFGWQMQDLNAQGAAGDARLASPEAGRAMLDRAARQLAEILADINRLPLSTMKRARRKG